MRQKLIIFLFFTAIYTAVTAILNLWPVDDLLSNIFIIIMVGLTVTIILTLIQWFVLKKKGIDQKNVNVVNSTAFIVKGTKEEVFHLCIKSVDNIKKGEVKNLDIEKGTIRGKAGTTWLSWGDRIDFEVMEIETDKYYVSVVSRPLGKTVVIDFGKNLENILLISDFFLKNEKLPVEHKGINNPS